MKKKDFSTLTEKLNLALNLTRLLNKDSQFKTEKNMKILKSLYALFNSGLDSPLSEDSKKSIIKSYTSNKEAIRLYNPSDYDLDSFLDEALNGFPDSLLELYKEDNYDQCKQKMFHLINEFEQDQKFDEWLLPYRMLAHHVLSLHKLEDIEALVKHLENRIPSGNFLHLYDPSEYDFEGLCNIACNGFNQSLIEVYSLDGFERCKQQSYDLIKTFEHRQKHDEWLLPYRMLAHYILNLDEAVEVEALKQLQNTDSQ